MDSLCIWKLHVDMCKKHIPWPVSILVNSISLLLVYTIYINNPKYWDRQAWANSLDPDQMLQMLSGAG